jgi:uncharacterized protein (DUF58 family)
MDSFLDEGFLKNLEKLKLVTRKGVKGPERGEHKSWHSGEGLEFLDYRKYQPGDDLRYVDWSVYGRLDKLFIKLFHAEENQTIHVLLDMSRSMQAGNPQKVLNAKRLAAAVGYISLASQDKVNMMAFTDHIVDMSPLVKGKRRYSRILNYLLSLNPDGLTDVNTCLTEYASICRNPGIAIVVSDLFDPKGYEDGLKALTYRNFDVNVVQVLDREELEWTQTGTFILEDIETGEIKRTSMDMELLEQYRQRVVAFLTGIREFCENYGIHHYTYDTQIPFEEFLVDYVTRGAVFR